VKSAMCKAGLHEECGVRVQRPDGKVFRCDDPFHKRVEEKKKPERKAA
jgi:hypothetical protein